MIEKTLILDKSDKLLFKIFLYVLSTALIAVIATFAYYGSHEFLGISPEETDPPLINPFWLLAVLCQFFAFKQIFMKQSSIGISFLTWIGVTVAVIIIGTMISALLEKL